MRIVRVVGVSLLRGLLLLLFVVSSATAHAEDDPDEEIARRRFVRGTDFYAANDYEKALAEFEAARRVKQAPAFDFNIARCLDRLERFESAILEYEKYLQAAPNAADAPGVRDRIAKLRTRIPATPARPQPQPQPVIEPTPVVVAPTPVVVAPTPPPPSAPDHRPRWTAAIALGAATVGVAVIGAALVGSVAPAYDDLERECGTQCAPSRVDALASRANAGYAMFGIAGALLVADVVVIALTAKRRTAPPTAQRSPLEVRF